MADEALLKTKSMLDNRDFNKGVQQMKQQMKDLNKVSSDAFAAIGNAIGVDTGKLGQFSSALQGLVNKLTQTGSEGASAFSKIGSAVTAVGAGIAGLGLAVAIAAFKQLNAEADAFEMTIQGGVIKAQTDAYLSTFKQVMRDQKAVGEEASNARSSFREGWARFVAGMNPMNNLETLTQADQAGQRAKDIAKELYDIDLKIKENAIQISQKDAQIAQQREIIYDTTRSAAERSAALAATQQLIKDKLNLQLPLEERRRDLIIEMNTLAGNTMEEFEQEIAAKVRVNNLIQQEATEQRSLLRQQKQIAAAFAEEAAEAEKVAAAIAKGVERAQEFATAQIEMSVSPEAVQTLQDYLSTAFVPKPVEVPVRIDTTQAEQAMLDLNDVIQQTLVDGITGIAESLGNLVGDFITGENGMAEFGQDFLEMIGSFAEKFGKVLIAFGVAEAAFKKSLEPPFNPIVAIVAGGALALAGAAVKKVASNMASTMSAASSSSIYTASSQSYAATDYSTREMEVKVTGTLVANGSQLVAVLNNENNRKSYTT